MSNDNLKNLIKSALELPVYDTGMSITFPSVTLDVYQDSPELCGDGKGKGRVKSVSVIIWHTTQPALLQSVARLTALLEATPGVTSPDVLTTFDTTARKFRATFTFETI